MADPELDPSLFIHHVERGVAALEELLEHEDLPLETWAVAFTGLEDLNRRLAELRAGVATKLGTAMGEYRVTVDGIGVLERKTKKQRREWDRDALLSAVLDSRLVDENTGEVADESPLQKVLHVWNLPAPRSTALKARHIDPDEFCVTERLTGWSIRVY